MTPADVACLRAAIRTKRRAQRAGKWLMIHFNWMGHNFTADGNRQERIEGKWLVFKRSIGGRIDFSRPLTAQQVIDIAKAHGWEGDEE